MHSEFRDGYNTLPFFTKPSLIEGTVIYKRLEERPWDTNTKNHAWYPENLLRFSHDASNHLTKCHTASSTRQIKGSANGCAGQTSQVQSVALATIKVTAGHRPTAAKAGSTAPGGVGQWSEPVEPIRDSKRSHLPCQTLPKGLLTIEELCQAIRIGVCPPPFSAPYSLLRV